MKYILENKSDSFEFNVIPLLNKNNSIVFNDPLDKKVVLTFNFINNDEIEFIRKGNESYMKLILKNGQFLEGKYMIEGYEFKLHSKCVEMNLDDQVISFKYKLYLNYKLENTLKITIIK